nr:site-specific DNA-methyltransferase [Candidatus Enterousia merdequi]
MPILKWLTRDEDIKKAGKAEYRLLKEDPKYSYGDKDTDNMIIHGDNLEALKALLPFYAGQIKCIYIDPPYNTGSAFEHYDDNLEHTTWLSMMYPRLELLRDLLSECGSIWISIDADEHAYLKILCDEVFGRKNFVDEVVWQRSYAPINLKKTFSRSTDYILVYCKNNELFQMNQLPRTLEADSRFSNPDNDPRGPWASGPIQAGPRTKSRVYEITTPSGRKILPPAEYCWRVSKEKFNEMVADNRIYFGPDGSNVPRIKRFLSEVKDGIVPLTLWLRDDVGDNQEGKKEIKTLFQNDVFSTPKPERLIQKVITLASNPGDLVLDSFLGSGTTAAVAHKMVRRYIGIELGNQATTHCVPRLKAVIDGEQGGISKAVNWQGGGGFRFYELGDAIFDEDGHVTTNITYEQLSAHLWFYETKTPFDKPKQKSTVLGVYKGTAYALLYNGILRDKRVDGGNVLTSKTLDVIKADLGNVEYDKLIVYGEASRLGTTRMRENNIEFKQTPYDIKVK